MATLEEYKSHSEIQWCPGCPNHLILKAVKSALVGLDLAPHEVCLVSGIGQAAKLPHYLECNFFNGLHGRALPAALGILAANPRLTTIVTTGEGDCYGEGGNHFIHTLRRNPDLTLIVHNNSFYALTKGQASPTTPLGEIRSLHPKGVPMPPLRVLEIAVIQGCGFVARGFAGDPEQLASLIVEGVRHRGLSIIDVIQPCITWGKKPLDWYREKAVPLPAGYDSSDRFGAFRAIEESERFYTGVLYRAQQKPVFGEDFHRFMKNVPLSELETPDEKTLREVLAPFCKGRPG
jgi:2-oxoglutarate ferredoxin oxidoreductase subunit beta